MKGLSVPPGQPDIELSVPRPAVALLTIVSEPLGVLRVGLKRRFRALLDDLESRHEVRCLVITGRGRAFSVGSDVKEFQRDEAWLRSASQTEQDLYAALECSRLPVLAACNGLTIGGGLELALACDVRLAGASARFGLPEALVGALPSGGGTQRLPRAVGLGNALELMYTGRSVTADEAKTIGLVQGVIPDDQLLDATIQMAESIARLPGSAIAATKRCVYEGLTQGSAAGFAMELDVTVDMGMSDDALEGQLAFIEKREPRFNQAR